MMCLNDSGYQEELERGLESVGSTTESADGERTIILVSQGAV